MPTSVPRGQDFKGSPIHKEAQDLTTPGSEQTLLSYTIPVAKTHQLFQIIVSCRIESFWTLDIDGTVIASGRTGSANPKDVFPVFPGRDIATGTVVTLKLKSRSNSPIVDCEGYIHASEF